MRVLVINFQRSVILLRPRLSFELVRINVILKHSWNQIFATNAQLEMTGMSRYILYDGAKT